VKYFKNIYKVDTFINKNQEALKAKTESEINHGTNAKGRLGHFTDYRMPWQQCYNFMW